MKVLCIANTGAALRTWPGADVTPESEYRLEIGKVYLVAGILLWKRRLSVLLKDENDLPLVTPVELVTVVDGRIPSWWKFASFANVQDSQLEAIWGYAMLVDLQSGHYDDLFELEPDALRDFRGEITKIEGEYRR